MRRGAESPGVERSSTWFTRSVSSLREGLHELLRPAGCRRRTACCTLRPSAGCPSFSRRCSSPYSESSGPDVARAARGRAWLEIDLGRLRHNVRAIKGTLPQGCELMAVVKGNAYGHGDVEVAGELGRAGVRAFAVATAQEGIRLRRHGIDGDILVLGYTHPDGFAGLACYDLIQTVVDADYARLLDEYGRPVRVHVKIDTGMHRLGEDYRQVERIGRIYASRNLSVEGIYTHLSVSDSLAAPDVAFTREQVRRFGWTVEQVRRLGYRPGKVHMQSSYGVLNYADLHCDYARVGIALYGVLSSPEDETKVRVDLRPVLSFRARVAELREVAPGEPVGYGRTFTPGRRSRIAVVTAGYADGVPRSLSCGRGSVLSGGIRVPIIGRICMDQMTIDVSDVPGVRPGDIVTIIGQDGTGSISAGEVAAKAGTITNELLSRLGHRPERVYTP